MCVHVFSESQPIFTAGQRIDNNFGLTRVSLGHTKISSINIKSEQNNLVAADKIKRNGTLHAMAKHWMENLDTQKIPNRTEWEANQRIEWQILVITIFAFSCLFSLCFVLCFLFCWFFAPFVALGVGQRVSGCVCLELYFFYANFMGNHKNETRKKWNCVARVLHKSLRLSQTNQPLCITSMRICVELWLFLSVAYTHIGWADSMQMTMTIFPF